MQSWAPRTFTKANKSVAKQSTAAVTTSPDAGAACMRECAADNRGRR